jgi:hypothetical protein
MKTHKQSKPWYKKWWVITLLVIFVAPPVLGIMFALPGAIKQANDESEHSSNQQPAESPKEQKPKDPDTLNASASYNTEAIEFINNESKDFSSCTFTLNQDYSYSSGKAYMVTSGQHAALYFANFTKDDGTRFNVYQTKPKYLSVWCHRKDGDSGKADIFWD